MPILSYLSHHPRALAGQHKGESTTRALHNSEQNFTHVMNGIATCAGCITSTQATALACSCTGASALQLHAEASVAPRTVVFLIQSRTNLQQSDAKADVINSYCRTTDHSVRSCAHNAGAMVTRCRGRPYLRKRSLPDTQMPTGASWQIVCCCESQGAAAPRQRLRRKGRSR